MLCELTHRCPLSCPYCSNPVELELKSNEISTDLWKTALSDGVKLGILQAHFSGGEPTARKDLEELVSHASKIGLYTNLITSGVLIKEDRLKNLYEVFMIILIHFKSVFNAFIEQSNQLFQLTRRAYSFQLLE
mgnify:CR=1 FL=1